MKVVMVEPNKPAYTAEIDSDLTSMQEIVGGLIEPIYYLNEPDAVMVGNEEAKLMCLEGNRRFGDRIVAGTFFICGDSGEEFCSLTDEQCEKYVREFPVPESIEQSEGRQDMGITFIGL